jgi:predicted negative regulator of RcsB-dependent stress response
VAAAVKKTRKELLKEPDEFITLSSRLIGFMATYKNAIVYALYAVMLAAAAFSGYVWYSGRQEAAASAQYERLRAEASPAKAVQEVAEDFQRILSGYGNSSNGNIARLLYANLCYEAGDFKQAAELYQDSLTRFTDDPLMLFQIQRSRGYAHEGLKDYATAVSYFEQALSAGEKNLQDDVLFHLGDLYSRLGNPQKSAEAFNRLLTEHKDSIYVNIVRERVGS